MAGWHHWLDGRESEWTPGGGDGQGGLACCDSWGRKESDTTERLNWTELNDAKLFFLPYPLFLSLLLLVANHVWLFWDPMDCIAHQAPLSLEFSRQEYCSGLPFPFPEGLPGPGIEPASPGLAGGFFTPEPLRKFVLLISNSVFGTVGVTFPSGSQEQFFRKGLRILEWRICFILLLMDL